MIPSSQYFVKIIILMSALFILVIASLVVAVGFLGAFIWSVRNNQFSDQKGAAMRMLFDDFEQKNKQ